jgi:hypothetical protein
MVPLGIWMGIAGTTRSWNEMTIPILLFKKKKKFLGIMGGQPT